MSKRNSLRARINLHCKNCIFDPYQTGTWRVQVKECTSPNCALFLVRPRPIATIPMGQPRSLNLAPELGLKAHIDDHNVRGCV